LGSCAIIIACLVGCALGVRYRVGSLITATLIAAALVAAGVVNGDVGIREGVLALVVLQLGYLVGLLLV
jgi:hypothetical protein